MFSSTAVRLVQIQTRSIKAVSALFDAITRADQCHACDGPTLRFLVLVVDREERYCSFRNVFRSLMILIAAVINFIEEPATIFCLGRKGGLMYCEGDFRLVTS